MIEQIKQQRVKIDGLCQLTKELKPLVINDGNTYNWSFTPTTNVESTSTNYLNNLLTANSREINKSVDSLILAKAWLGKLLYELGDKNPYSSGKKTVEDIEPTADVNEDIHGYNLEVVHFEDKSHIEKIDWLRSEIQSVIDDLLKMQIGGNSSSALLRIATENSYTHLCEAKMWLGFEFHRIREESI